MVTHLLRVLYVCFKQNVRVFYQCGSKAIHFTVNHVSPENEAENRDLASRIARNSRWILFITKFCEGVILCSILFLIQ